MSIKKVAVKYFNVPTKTPERDGTLEWSSTGLVTVELYSEDTSGLGYTYADKSTAEFIINNIAPLVLGKSEKNNLLLVEETKKVNRNLGNAGVTSMALSAIDTALWDLKAKTLKLSIQDLLGQKRQKVPFYGSGLFLNNSQDELVKQIEVFKSHGMKNFKMKIGLGPDQDSYRVRLVQGLLEKDDELFVDANGFYRSKEALRMAMKLEELGVHWFEEPVSSDDTLGMHFLREKFPPDVNLVSGEYCYQISDVLRMLQNSLVDILMIDATRCEGVSGTLKASFLSKAFNIPLSTHCAPLLHGNIGVCLEEVFISECFYDHLRIENNYFDYEGIYHDGFFIPSQNQLGFGWRLKSNRDVAYEYVAS